MIPVLLMFYFLGGLKLLVNLSSFTYPAYKSLQAISANDPSEDKQWLTYWVKHTHIHFIHIFPQDNIITKSKLTIE
jgi:hypothetical protein